MKPPRQCASGGLPPVRRTCGAQPATSRIRRLAGGALLALVALDSVAADAQTHRTQAARCDAEIGAEPFARTELYFGLARPGGVVSEAEFQRFMDREVTPRFPAGQTVLDANGRFRDASGQVQSERSKLLILLVPHSDPRANAKVEQIRTAYRHQFDQQSVLRTDAPACGSFQSTPSRPDMNHSLSRATLADDPEVAMLVERATQAHVALMRGDLAAYQRQIETSDDFVLMSPFGGPPSHAAAFTAERWVEIARFFRDGRGSTLELVQAWRSDELVVLAVIERTVAEIGGLPAQAWPLRVTLVFRREGDGWRLAHRHADALVRGISVQQAAALAAGAGAGSDRP